MPRRGVPLQGRVRWLLLGLFLLLVLLLLAYLLECTPPAADVGPAPPGVAGETYGKEHHQALLQEQEERHLSRAASLKRQIAQLKQELQEMGEKMKLLQEKKELPGAGPGPAEPKDQEPGDLLEYLHSQIDKAEVNGGARLPSEYALVPFESFTSSKVYQLETGLTRHPEEKPVRKDRRDELVEVMEAALDIINNPDEEDGVEEDAPMQRRTYAEGHFTEGEGSASRGPAGCRGDGVLTALVSQACTGRSATRGPSTSSSSPSRTPAASATSPSSGPSAP